MDIQLKPIIREITVIGENFCHTFVEDFTEYAIDLIEAGCNGLDESNIYEFFAEGEFEDREIPALNGEHFLYGFCESLLQSERCPCELLERTCSLKFVVKEIKTEGNLQ